MKNTEFTKQELMQAKEEIVSNFGHGGQARILMISVENYERGDYIRDIDRKIVNHLLEEKV